MTEEELKEYLEMTADLEKDVFFQNVMLQGIDREITSLGRPSPVGKAAPPSLLDGHVFFKLGLLAALVALFGYLFAEAWQSAWWGFLVGIIVFVIVVLLDFRRDYIRKQGSFERYQQVLLDDAVRLKKESVQTESLRREREALARRQEASKELLEEVYGLGVIRPEDRRFIPVCSYCGYFEAGRCGTLEGEDGAYRLFEKEKEQQRVVTQMVQFSVRSGLAEQNQPVLFRAVKEGNETAARILEDVAAASRSPEETGGQSADRLRAWKT